MKIESLQHGVVGVEAFTPIIREWRGNARIAESRSEKKCSNSPTVQESGAVSDKILELGRHDPSVESVTTRLYQNMDKIKSITAIVEWFDGSYDVCCDTKDIAFLCFDREILSKFIQGFVEDKLNDRK